MKFIAIIKHRNRPDYNGVGHQLPMIAKEFSGDTKIEIIWEWYWSDNYSGTLEIVKITE